MPTPKYKSIDQIPQNERDALVRQFFEGAMPGRAVSQLRQRVVPDPGYDDAYSALAWWAHEQRPPSETEAQETSTCTEAPTIDAQTIADLRAEVADLKAQIKSLADMLCTVR